MKIDERAQAYMAMEATPDSGWHHLKAWLQQKIDEASEAVMSPKGTKHWMRSDNEITDKVYKIVIQSHAFQEVIKHVEKEIRAERERIEKANHRDSQE